MHNAADGRGRQRPATQTREADTARDFDTLCDPSSQHAALQWCFVIGFHPDLRRIGQRSTVLFDEAAPLEFGRDVPVFTTAGSRERGIEDSYISGRAFRLEPEAAAWRLHREPGRSRLRLNAQEIHRDALLTQATLRAGVVLTLAERVVVHLRLQAPDDVSADGESELSGLVGVSPAMQQLRCSIRNAARASADVLLVGPTGSGKERVAQAIHELSARAAAPWVAVNMAALPVDVAAASLFGARRGAYTGADSHRRGYFQEADGGTLFLDEVGDAPHSLQPMLLRALQEREIQVLGGRSKRVDLRVVSAMEHDPDDPEQGLRPALRHRLGAIEIRLPTLAERVEDIGVLAVAELRELWRRRAESGSETPREEQELARWARCFELLHCYHWPGNVRELQHAARQIAIASEQELCVPAALQQRLRSAVGETPDQTQAGSAAVHEELSAPTRLSDISDEEFTAAWREANFEVAALARRFGVSRPAIYRRLKSIPECRLAADVPLGELLAMLDTCCGDLASTAERLAISRRGLEARLRASGVRSARDRQNQTTKANRSRH